MNKYDLANEELFAQNMNVRFRESFGKDILIWWVSVSVIYTVLYFQYLEGPFVSSIGGHVAGFFGIFTPVGLLSLMVSILPNYFIANIIALVLMVLAVFLCSRVRITGIKRIIFILAILFVVTYISDIARSVTGEGFTSWEIMINGKLPSVR